MKMENTMIYVVLTGVNFHDFVSHFGCVAPCSGVAKQYLDETKDVI